MRTSLSIKLWAIATLVGLFLGQAVSASQTPASFLTAIRYDVAGRTLGTILPDPDGSGPLLYPATRNTYNNLGQLESEETGELTAWQDENTLPSAWGANFKVLSSRIYRYNTYGQMTVKAQLDANGVIVQLVQQNYNDSGLVNCKTLRLGMAGKAVSAINTLSDACFQSSADDRVTQYGYNQIDMVTTEKRAKGTALEQTYVTNTYKSSLNSNGLFISRTLETQKDANNNLTKYEYDSYGRLWRTYFPSATKGAGAANPSDYQEITYDYNNNIKTERKRSGATITYTYDNLNRRTYKDLSDNTRAEDIKYVYDLRSLQKSALYQPSNKGLSYGYDGFGRLTSATSTMGPSRTLTYSYDANSNREKITFPDNTFFTYEFDGLNRVTALRDQNIDSAQTGQLLVNLTYNPNGKRDVLARISGSSTLYGYNQAQRLNTFKQTFNDANYNLFNEFNYNPAGQITELTQNNSLYTYQGNQNRTGTYVPDGLNRYSTVNGTSLGYDGNGNLVNDGSSTYGYDMENRLVSVTGTPSASFVYDPNGRLFKTTINGTERQFLYDGDALVAEYDSAGVMQRRYVHGDQVDEPWVQYNSNSVSSDKRIFLHGDHQGSIVAQSNSAGFVTNAMAYDAYGIPANVNGDRFGYTGQAWFKELGLNYYKARVYSPKLGRFLQTDPIGYKDGMNLYAYAGNDSINNIDPNGTTCYSMTYGMGSVCAGLGLSISNSSSSGAFALAARALAAESAAAIAAGGLGSNIWELPAANPWLLLTLAIAPTKVADGTLGNQPAFRGRIQAQGGGLERSVPWAQNSPPTVTQGLTMVSELKAQLSAKQLAERSSAFIRAERFIKNAGPYGVMPTKQTFLERGTKDIRVDIEVQSGQAFVGE